MLYLKIENPGVAPLETLTTLGVGFSRYSTNSNTVGAFSSGVKMSANVLLRNNINPIIFCGNLKLEYFTKTKLVTTDQTSREFEKVCVKLSGKTDDGKTRNTTEELGYSLEYGEADWNDIAMALREYVSNAIDQNLQVNGTWNDVKVKITDSVRAKSGHTRVFVPVTPDVQEFYKNLGKWFLHFSEPDIVKNNVSVLPKKDRNFRRQTAVIYKKGVRVREIGYPDNPSLFDYNLNELRLDESRTASDYDTKFFASKALGGAKKQHLIQYFESFGKGTFWEHTFDSYYLKACNDDEEQKNREAAWQEAFEVFGENAVMVDENASNEVLVRKGFKPIKVPSNVVNAAEKFGVKTPSKVLSEDDRLGREILEPNEAAIDVLDYCWAMLVASDLTQGKVKPSVKLFNDIMRAESTVKGFYRIGGDTIYLNRDICSGMSEDLKMTCLEELGHYVTGSLDNSRDFQDFFIRLAIRIAE